MVHASWERGNKEADIISKVLSYCGYRKKKKKDIKNPMVDGKSTMSRHLSVLVVILFFLFLSLSATFVYASRMKYYFAWFNKEKRNWRLLPRKQFVLIHTLRKIRSNTLYAIPYDILWKLNKKKKRKRNKMPLWSLNVFIYGTFLRSYILTIRIVVM